MNFGQAIASGFSNYANFNGRASRSEFWWWVLFGVLVSAACVLVHTKLSGLLSLVLFLPNIAMAARRLHDTSRSGWMQLIGIIPIIGWIFTLIWYVEASHGPNEYGPAPEPMTT